MVANILCLEFDAFSPVKMYVNKLNSANSIDFYYLYGKRKAIQNKRVLCERYNQNNISNARMYTEIVPSKHISISSCFSCRRDLHLTQ